MTRWVYEGGFLNEVGERHNVRLTFPRELPPESRLVVETLMSWLLVELRHVVGEVRVVPPRSYKDLERRYYELRRAHEELKAKVGFPP